MNMIEFNRHKEGLRKKLPLLKADEKGWLNVPDGTLTDLWSLIYGITNGITDGSSIIKNSKFVNYKEII